MIIGSGMMAKAVQTIHDESYIYFCSGVSNSKEVNNEEFDREIELLAKFYGRGERLIYFSSYFVNFENYLGELYYRHKLKVEGLIKDNFPNFLILRLPQVVGLSNNKNTLTNFLFQSITSNSTINVFKNAKRNLIDIDDVIKVLHSIVSTTIYNNQVVNIVGTKNYSVEDIIFIFENITNKMANKKEYFNFEREFPILLSENIIRYIRLSISNLMIYIYVNLLRSITAKCNKND